jgi:hypothetical protein
LFLVHLKQIVSGSSSVSGSSFVSASSSYFRFFFCFCFRTAVAAVSASVTCHECDVGKYAPLAGSPSCITCEQSERKYTDVTGSLHCLVCPNGQSSAITTVIVSFVVLFFLFFSKEFGRVLLTVLNYICCIAGNLLQCQTTVDDQLPLPRDLSIRASLNYSSTVAFFRTKAAVGADAKAGKLILHDNYLFGPF